MRIIIESDQPLSLPDDGVSSPGSVPQATDAAPIAAGAPTDYLMRQIRSQSPISPSSDPSGLRALNAGTLSPQIRELVRLMDAPSPAVTQSGR